MKYFEIDPEIRQQIAKIYHTDLHEDIEALREWAERQYHLPERPSDNLLEKFHVLNKCRLEKTKSRVDMYYTIRTIVPEFFENTNPGLAHMKTVMDQIFWIPLPKLSEEHHRVNIFKFRTKTSSNDLNPSHFFAHCYNVAEVRIHEDFVQGDVMIFDMEGCGTGLLKKLTPALLYKTSVVFEKVWSSPTKGLHFVNCPGFFGSFVSVLKSVFKPKLSARIHLHPNNDSLYKFFAKETLPSDYGGMEKSLVELNELLKLKLEEYQHRFDLLDQLRVDESLRPEMLKNDDILGFHGNFKQLSLD